mmetsp:Transcript_39267/g.39758  ORF Transcript_39267/g.39758 Transcript_39267/m.39758 type:complete len:201 (-) Transcript_39267:347-949(-)|eukprot:CAMPEP_0171294736 /NCGR_PEP_ID=MMETSP0816-20121228/3221_1 /TAXON_ID=420281 /ORGANISM="Proboscia inermis, Strain CCAP1064/1" /LENGTH=200 /DNA_ID=CAMNT_0011766789 /DNA_START=30 /DNA_END=632 /DNA_ORIENTATION=+
MGHAKLIVTVLTTIAFNTNAFHPSSISPPRRAFLNTFTAIRMSEEPTPETKPVSEITPTIDMPASALDKAMEKQMDEQMVKQKKADELRAQEVFIQKPTGRHRCMNCDWEYDEDKGDVAVIGGQIAAGTEFLNLPSNWRCPTCRASKDSFEAISIEIPGFEVNQGYGFGGNSLSGDEKSGLVFGGLAVMAVLMIAGYGLS